jgi:hypothetical protein
MNERTQVWVGLALLIVGSAIVLLYSFPTLPIPAALAVLAALGMSAGTLLVGTSKGTV